jgi:hypothetical protein
MGGHLAVDRGELITAIEGVKCMDRRSLGASGSVAALGIVLALAGCGRPSQIVQMLEKAGAGDLRTASVGSIVQWFEHHPSLALKVDNLCVPVREKAQAKWPETTEGRVCRAAAQVAGFIVWQREIETSNDHRTFQGGSK